MRYRASRGLSFLAAIAAHGVTRPCPWDTFLLKLFDKLKTAPLAKGVMGPKNRVWDFFHLAAKSRLGKAL
jgi:hypothetical protein